MGRKSFKRNLKREYINRKQRLSVSGPYGCPFCNKKTVDVVRTKNKYLVGCDICKYTLKYDSKSIFDKIDYYHLMKDEWKVIVTVMLPLTVISGVFTKLFGEENTTRDKE